MTCKCTCISIDLLMEHFYTTLYHTSFDPPMGNLEWSQIACMYMYDNKRPVDQFFFMIYSHRSHQDRWKGECQTDCEIKWQQHIYIKTVLQIALTNEKPLQGEEQETEQNWSRDKKEFRGLLCCSPQMDVWKKKKKHCGGWRRIMRAPETRHAVQPQTSLSGETMFQSFSIPKTTRNK